MVVMGGRNTFFSFNNSDKDSIDYLLGILEDARFTTLDRVKDITIDELHWQYDNGWNTIGALLSHIIACENFFRIYFVEERELSQIENDEYLPAIEMGKYIPQLITKNEIDYYIQNLEMSRTKLVQEITTLNKESFYKKREGYNSETGFNLAWLLYHLAEDEVHHRGQISIIRKLYKNG